MPPLPRLLMCLFLPPLLTACASRPVAGPATEPPPALVAPCWPGPQYPPGDVPLAELLEVVARREAAAADCRARHAALARAWPR
ncbi:MAG: Rz1-like lysis system protein LysC [Caldilineaceae bacterium]